MIKYKLSYYFIRLLPIRYVPHPLLRAISSFLGSLAYYLIPKFRKRALSNLALATDLHLSNADIRKTARASLQNVMLVALEYSKFQNLKKPKRYMECVNPDIPEGGCVFFCGHQANWETFFLEGTYRMKGTAIGRPIKNKYLYNWVLKLREQFGGKIIPPKDAIKEGMRALKRGDFLGIVGDQALVDSGFRSSFLGRDAWTSPIPAMLAYKTKKPLITATAKRIKGKYFIHYSKPIMPDQALTREVEVPRMMKEALSYLETSIKETPYQWLWIHNRWKQETTNNIFYRFRHDAILLILETPDLLKTFRTIYPLSHITALLPKKITHPDIEILEYQTRDDLLLDDYRFKCIYNFTEHDVKKHYMRLSAFEVLSKDDLYQIAKPHLKIGDTCDQVVLKAITRPNTLWRKDES